MSQPDKLRGCPNVSADGDCQIHNGQCGTDQATYHTDWAICWAPEVPTGEAKIPAVKETAPRWHRPGELRPGRNGY